MYQSTDLLYKLFMFHGITLCNNKILYIRINYEVYAWLRSRPSARDVCHLLIARASADSG